MLNGFRVSGQNVQVTQTFPLQWRQGKSIELTLPPLQREVLSNLHILTSNSKTAGHKKILISGIDNWKASGGHDVCQYPAIIFTRQEYWRKVEKGEKKVLDFLRFDLQLGNG